MPHADTHITHVAYGHDYAKVHRLIEPTDRIPDQAPLACGRRFKSGLFASGWSDFPEDLWFMCKQCRNVPRDM